MPAHLKVTFPGGRTDTIIDMNDLDDNHATAFDDGLWLLAMEYAMAKYTSDNTCINPLNNTVPALSERTIWERKCDSYRALSNLPGLDVMKLITSHKAYFIKTNDLTLESTFYLIALATTESLIVTAGIPKHTESQSYPELNRNHQYNVLGYYPYQQKILLRKAAL